MSTPVTMVLIGAGNRGRGIFGQYALDMPHRAKFVAVVEPDAAKREDFARAHGISEDGQFADVRELEAMGKRLADAVVIAALENQRLGPAQAARKLGYHILIEKPLGTNIRDVVALTDLAQSMDQVFIVCHQMRHTPLYSALKGLLDSGQFGAIVSIQHSENLAFSHMAHSFVRGLFNNSALTPMIVAKSCHDMDFLRWIVGRRPQKIASFGLLRHFRPENAPAGAPARCLDGCPAESTCPYSVLKLYFNDDTDRAYLRQMGVIHDRRELMEVLKTNQFGRCVYHAGNDVVDHQVVQILFEGGVTVGFAMCGHNAVERRITKISLDRGEIELDISKQSIRAFTFSPYQEQVITPSGGTGTHGGGDRAIMDSFVDAIRTGDKARILTPVGMSLDSHLMAFAAEEARVTGQVIDMADYEAKVRASL